MSRQQTQPGPELIQSPRNPRVVAALKLRRTRERRLQARTLLEGPNVVGAAVEAGHQPEVVFALSGDQLAESTGAAVYVSREVLDRLAPTQHPRGPVAVIGIPPSVSVSGSCLVLWGVADPGNLGTLIRSAAAFDMDVAVDATSADPWSPKALRAAAGAHFRIRVETGITVESLRARGHSLVASVPAAGVDIGQINVPSPVAILVGSEARGLPEAVADAADQRVTIPMPGGTESLNAGVAGAILAYEWRRGHRGERRGRQGA